MTISELLLSIGLGLMTIYTFFLMSALYSLRAVLNEVVRILCSLSEHQQTGKEKDHERKRDRVGSEWSDN